MTDTFPPVIIDYTNWRGERSERRIKPYGIRFAATEWHPEPQYLLFAACLDRGGAIRDFAMTNIHSWKPAND